MLKTKNLKNTNRDRKRQTKKMSDSIQLTAKYKIIFSCHYNHLIPIWTLHSYVYS